MSKKKFEVELIDGVGLNEAGVWLVVMITNYGVLIYHSGYDVFELNNVIISPDEYELENVYKEVIKATSTFAKTMIF